MCVRLVTGKDKYLEDIREKADDVIEKTQTNGISQEKKKD